MPGEVPVAVVREIENRGFICRCLVMDLESVVFRQAVGDHGAEIAWVAFFAIG